MASMVPSSPLLRGQGAAPAPSGATAGSLPPLPDADESPSPIREQIVLDLEVQDLHEDVEIAEMELRLKRKKLRQAENRRNRSQGSPEGLNLSGELSREMDRQWAVEGQRAVEKLDVVVSEMTSMQRAYEVNLQNLRAEASTEVESKVAQFELAVSNSYASAMQEMAQQFRAEQQQTLKTYHEEMMSQLSSSAQGTTKVEQQSMQAVALLRSELLEEQQLARAQFSALNSEASVRLNEVVSQNDARDKMLQEAFMNEVAMMRAESDEARTMRQEVLSLRLELQSAQNMAKAEIHAHTCKYNAMFESTKAEFSEAQRAQLTSFQSEWAKREAELKRQMSEAQIQGSKTLTFAMHTNDDDVMPKGGTSVSGPGASSQDWLDEREPVRTQKGIVKSLFPGPEQNSSEPKFGNGLGDVHSDSESASVESPILKTGSEVFPKVAAGDGRADSMQEILYRLVMAKETPQTKEADVIKFPMIPTAAQFKAWKTEVRSIVASASKDPSGAFAWILEVESDSATYESLAIPSPQFETLDAKVSAGLAQVCKGELGRRVTLKTEEEAKVKRLIKGRQILWMIYEEYRLNQEAGALHDITDLMKLQLKKEHTKVEHLDTFMLNWRTIIAGMKEEPPETTLQVMLCERVRNLQCLAADIAVYDRAKAGTFERSYRFLVEAIDRLLERHKHEKN